ncbi:hypothetical protein FYK55_26635 [Roseiconus nitratireducens]|uniref:Uncharacterized protein n=1 Tax=Roseiconus nitratireducens TaxID=2605748 RepID=A0A5M6CUF4_9BACT|nr:glycoside hydrolase [Roseiconus nitratireducens]KAA5538693.1 hypothetical protein FYK55_26635 [Roseiconus nitratireducens]
MIRILRCGTMSLVVLIAAALLASELVATPNPSLSDVFHGQSLETSHCEFDWQDGTLRIRVTGDGIGTVEAPIVEVSGPVILHFRLKTAVAADFGEYVLFWHEVGDSGWKRFRRIPFHADGRWHSYRIPLSATGTVDRLRIAFGAQRHEVSIDGIRCERIEQATVAADSLAPTSETPVAIESERLQCRFESKKRLFEIRDHATGRRWVSDPISSWLSMKSVQKDGDTGLKLRIHDSFSQGDFTIAVSVQESTCRFEIEADDPSCPMETIAEFPPRFRCASDQGMFVFCDRSCGVLLDQVDPTYAGWPLRVWGNTHCLDLPWVGWFDEQRRDAMMLLVETAADAEIAFRSDDDGRHWPEVHWLPSLDQFGYKRAVSLRFVESGGYVGLARCYRQELLRRGKLVTFADKLAKKPELQRLSGAPSLWGWPNAEAFIDRMRPLGIRRGIIGSCDDPAVVARLNRQGYLTSCYDSYTDFTSGVTGFQRDDVDAAALRPRPGGPAKLGWRHRDGTQMYWRSSTRWQAAENAYVDLHLSQTGQNSRFVDVAAAAELLEDYHPQHPADRRTDLMLRRGVFERMNQRGLVVGAEHGNDWVADQVDYTEGSMSGPFWWSSWPAGYLDAPSKDQLTPNYLKFGMGFAHRIPLWQLVYHDCVGSTWYWGDNAGLLHQASPELADRKDLFNILYGTAPLIWMNGTGYQLPDQEFRLLRTFHETCPLHEVLAFEAMVDHQFLVADRSVQRTQFSDGTTVVVNFSSQPYPYDVDGEIVVLSPQGFWVKGPRIEQSRLRRGSIDETVIHKQGYLTVQSDGSRMIEGVRVDGRVTLFRVTENRWNLFAPPGADIHLHVPRVTGWSGDRPVKLAATDSVGEICGAVASPGDDGVVSFQSDRQQWRFALIRQQANVRGGDVLPPNAH